jgi:hypothetical protein
MYLFIKLFKNYRFTINSVKISYIPCRQLTIRKLSDCQILKNYLYAWSLLFNFIKVQYTVACVRICQNNVRISLCNERWKRLCEDFGLKQTHGNERTE